MSKKRGLSVEEKRLKLKEIFLETKDVYTLKDLEKIAPKSKGVVAQSVKDVLQSLADDGEVKGDKIGTSNYFWCFPSDELNNRTVKLDKLNTEVESLKRKREKLENEIKELKKERPESEDRSMKLLKVNELEKENQSLKTELAAYADNNPLLVTAMKEDAEVAKEATNRWTDNLYTIVSYLKKNFNVDQQQITQNFGIPEDLDYV